ncbi:hypothetical protein VNO77_44073 [Canavalia gladiata]|uniref:Uncharacterized protein n=1 Tax=Canavalia gladiata TaxID=3824 RepID=A0AAN9JXW2_CANGL
MILWIHSPTARCRSKSSGSVILCVAKGRTALVEVLFDVKSNACMHKGVEFHAKDKNQVSEGHTNNLAKEKEWSRLSMISALLYGESTKNKKRKVVDEISLLVKDAQIAVITGSVIEATNNFIEMEGATMIYSRYGPVPLRVTPNEIMPK